MHPAPLAAMDYVGPALGALVFVAVMSLVAEPTRRTLNAIILASAELFTVLKFAGALYLAWLGLLGSPLWGAMAGTLVFAGAVFRWV